MLLSSRCGMFGVVGLTGVQGGMQDVDSSPGNGDDLYRVRI
jgi:hypothetical protein